LHRTEGCDTYAEENSFCFYNRCGCFGRRVLNCMLKSWHNALGLSTSSLCNNMHDSFVDIKMEHDYDDFGFSAATKVQMGPMYGRPTQPSSPQPLHSLVIVPEWSSQITNPSENSSPPAPIPVHRPILPLSKTAPVLTLAPAPAPSKPSHKTFSSRKTLTDGDRRRICRYHSENPNVKQTEIGGGCGILSYLRSSC